MIISENLNKTLTFCSFFKHLYGLKLVKMFLKLYCRTAHFNVLVSSFDSLFYGYFYLIVIQKFYIAI